MENKKEFDIQSVGGLLIAIGFIAVSISDFMNGEIRNNSTIYLKIIAAFFILFLLGRSLLKNWKNTGKFYLKNSGK